MDLVMYFTFALLLFVLFRSLIRGNALRHRYNVAVSEEAKDEALVSQPYVLNGVQMYKHLFEFGS